MSSFLGHFPVLCIFFSTKTTDSVVTTGSHFLRNHKKMVSFPYFWQKSLVHIFKKAIKSRVVSIKNAVSLDKMGLKIGHFPYFLCL
jgi:hypothetical protein